MSSCPATLAESFLDSLAQDPLLLVLVGAAAAVVVFLAFLRRGPRRAAETAHPPSSSRELEGLMDELEQVAEALSARFDAQAARLETLIREAEAKTRSLEGALGRAKAGQILEEARSMGGDGHESGLAALSRHREIYEMADAGRPAAEIAQNLRRPEGEVALILALRGAGGIS